MTLAIIKMHYIVFIVSDIAFTSSFSIIFYFRVLSGVKLLYRYPGINWKYRVPYGVISRLRQRYQPIWKNILTDITDRIYAGNFSLCKKRSTGNPISCRHAIGFFSSPILHYFRKNIYRSRIVETFVFF